MARSVTTRSTNPKIMDDNIKILDDNLGKASAPDAEDVVYDNTGSGLTADDVQAAIDVVNGKFSTLVPCQLLQIANIGEHTSIRLSLADNDTFCVVTLVGATGTYGQYLITATTSIKIIESGYSVTKNADKDFTITCTGNWTRAIVYAFAPVPNAITYTIPE